MAVTFLACAVLLLASGVYIFWNRRTLRAPVVKTRVDYLRERKDVVYENLRDLNFEYRAGKYPAEDYAEQREALETEAAVIVREMEGLQARGMRGA
jgi:hypothetical protein